MAEHTLEYCSFEKGFSKLIRRHENIFGKENVSYELRWDDVGKTIHARLSIFMWGAQGSFPIFATSVESADEDIWVSNSGFLAASKLIFKKSSLQESFIFEDQNALLRTLALFLFGCFDLKGMDDNG